MEEKKITIIVQLRIYQLFYINFKKFIRIPFLINDEQNHLT